ncbi:hypothetical protein Aph02nite_45070 [Actinoplanes philippinensis]|uniref:hypothetical protein n=1 Tax=Actinoplanes philippinensis TaxID=35752 RepID=UPI000B88FC54|nr:hypothetical protein [Actinoplanes philippinensis]GIE78557.1 hypothetical protein Aph02nite_45070 [Actinoplanes philippinensis]
MIEAFPPFAGEVALDVVHDTAVGIDDQPLHPVGAPALRLLEGGEVSRSDRVRVRIGEEVVQVDGVFGGSYVIRGCPGMPAVSRGTFASATSGGQTARSSMAW